MNRPAAERIAEIRRENLRHRVGAEIVGSDLMDLVEPAGAQVRDLLEVIDHVREVLREAERNNGGYGFVRSLLEYIGG